MAEGKLSINQSTTLSIAFVGVLVAAAFTGGVQLTQIKADLVALKSSMGLVAADVAELNGKIVGKSCEGVHRPQLLSFAQSLKLRNPAIKVPNPYNPRHMPFPADRDCVELYDRTPIE